MSEEQKRRMEANRAAALARKCAKTQSVIAPVPLHHSGSVVPQQFTGIQLTSNIEGWKTSGGVSGGNHQDPVGQKSPLEKLEVVLEMCAPTKFVLMLVGGLRDHDSFQDCLQKFTAVSCPLTPHFLFTAKNSRHSKKVTDLQHLDSYVIVCLKLLSSLFSSPK